MTKTFQFQTLRPNVKPFPKHTKFMEAWNDMFLYVNDLIKKGEASYQIIETTLWIEVSELHTCPIMFYDACDKAIREYGWKKP